MTQATDLQLRLTGFRATNQPLHLAAKWAGAPQPTHAMCGTPLTDDMRRQTSFFDKWFDALCDGCGDGLDRLQDADVKGARHLWITTVLAPERPS